MDNGFAEGYAVGQGNSNSNNGWGNGGWEFMWIILLFAMWGGNGFGGWGNNGGGAAMQGALTREQACIDNNFQNLMRETAGISDAVNLGFANLNSTICSQQYDTAQMINSMNISNLQSFNALQAQLAQCCCGIERAIDGVNYNMATNTCNITNTINNSTRDIIASQECGTRAVIEKLCQMEYNSLNDKYQMALSEIQGLRLDASQARQNSYLVSQLRPTPNPAFIVPNPFAGYYGYNGNGCGNSCGCNNF